MPMTLTASKRTCATVLPAFLEFEQDTGHTPHISLNRTQSRKSSYLPPFNSKH